MLGLLRGWGWLSLSYLVIGAVAAAVAFAAAIVGVGSESGGWLLICVSACAYSVIWALMDIRLRGNRCGRSPERRKSLTTLATLAVIAAAVSYLLLGGMSVEAILLVAVAALAEEVLFRWIPRQAVLVSGSDSFLGNLVVAGPAGILFVVLHGNGHPAYVADRIVFAVMAYMMCVITGSVWLAWLAHLASNLLASVLLAGSSEGISPWQFLCVSALVSAALLVMATRNRVPVVAGSIGCDDELECK